MVNFTKIFGLTGARKVAGLANAQQVCTAGTPPTNIIRSSEGTTELLPQLTINSPRQWHVRNRSYPGVSSPALNITSKTLATGVTEAVVTYQRRKCSGPPTVPP